VDQRTDQPGPGSGSVSSGSRRPRIRSRALALFTALNWAAAFFLAYRYILVGPPFVSPRGAIFVHLALAGQIGVFVLLIVGCAALPSSWSRASFLTRPAAALLATLLHLFLFIDGTVFSLFRFHTNALVFNVLVTPGGFNSMQLPLWQLAAAAAGVLAVLSLEWWGLGRLEDLVAQRKRSLARPGVAWMLIVGSVLIAGLSERGMYVLATMRGDPLIPRLARSIPFYQPVLIRGLSGAGVGATGEPTGDGARRGLLAYPQRQLAGKIPAGSPNVLWIVLDGWRADLLDPETTPAIWEFSRGAQVFRRHESGGNSTRAGIFSMFYGLHGSYWQPVFAEGRGPVILAKLREAGYRFKVLAAAPLDYPEFSRTVFSEVTAAIDDQMPGDSWWRKDETAVARLGAFFAGIGAEERFFAFLFLNATHNPFESPESHRLFQPAATVIDWIEIRARRGMPELFNRYRNAVHWDDELVGRVLGSLRERGLAASTIVVITADHGHAFYEHGYFGYNGAFTPEEIGVPLVVAVPGMAPQVHCTPSDAISSTPPRAPTVFPAASLRARFTTSRGGWSSEPRGRRCCVSKPGTAITSSSTTAAPRSALARRRSRAPSTRCGASSGEENLAARPGCADLRINRYLYV